MISLKASLVSLNVQTWFLRKALCEYWRFFSQENSNTVKLFSVPASKHTKHRGLQQERKWTVEKPFCIQTAQKSLFSAASMMITVLKDTTLWYLNTETPIDGTVTLWQILLFISCEILSHGSFHSNPKSLSLSGYKFYIAFFILQT